MARIHYRIVAHDGGWAYKLNDVFSEPFPSKSAALAAAKGVAAEQHVFPVTAPTSSFRMTPALGILNSRKGTIGQMPMWFPSDRPGTEEPMLLASNYISVLFREIEPLPGL